MNEVIFMNEYELYHSGILGMKWGQRRYQNPDGTYTEEGKARRRKSDLYSADEKRKRELAKKPSSQLSNKELQELNNRYNLESQRRNYEKTGRTWVGTVVSRIKDQSANIIAAAVVGAGVAYWKANKDRFIEDVAWQFVK